MAADYDASVATLESIALSLGNELKTQISLAVFHFEIIRFTESDCVLLRERVLSGSGPASELRTGQYLIRKKADTQDFTEIRCAVVGNVDAGKSTLLGVLTHGELDNGNLISHYRNHFHLHDFQVFNSSNRKGIGPSKIVPSQT